MHASTFVSSPTKTPVGSCSRDPIGYSGGGNSLYQNYFVLKSTDPSGLGPIHKCGKWSKYKRGIDASCLGEGHGTYCDGECKKLGHVSGTITAGSCKYRTKDCVRRTWVNCLAGSSSGYKEYEWKSKCTCTSNNWVCNCPKTTDPNLNPGTPLDAPKDQKFPVAGACRCAYTTKDGTNVKTFNNGYWTKSGTVTINL